jgi:hypothetical protein
MARFQLNQHNIVRFHPKTTQNLMFSTDLAQGCMNSTEKDSKIST